GDVRAVLQEMRDRQVARRFKSQTLTDWADRIEAALAAEGVQAGYDTPPDWYARREQHAREMGYTGLADALDDLERRRGEGVQAGEVEFDRVLDANALDPAALRAFNAVLAPSLQVSDLLAYRLAMTEAIASALSQPPEAR